MNDLTPGSGRRVSRRTREQRAYRIVMVGGVAGAVAVVTFVLAIAGVVGLGIPIIAAIIAVACWLLFRRAVASSR